MKLLLISLNRSFVAILGPCLLSLWGGMVGWFSCNVGLSPSKYFLSFAILPKQPHNIPGWLFGWVYYLVTASKHIFISLGNYERGPKIWRYAWKQWPNNNNHRRRESKGVGKVLWLMVYERQSVVNLSFSFRTPSTSSYLLPGLMVRYGERRQKTTNHDNENSSLIFVCL